MSIPISSSQPASKNNLKSKSKSSSQPDPILNKPVLNKSKSESNSKRVMRNNSESEQNESGNEYENRSDSSSSSDALDEQTVKTMLNLAKSKKFPKRLFKFGNKKRKYTPVTHFFHCITDYRAKPEKITFQCKFSSNCKPTSQPIGNFSYLNKHLNTHERGREWYSYFKEENNELSEGDYKLMHYFIESGNSLHQLTFKTFRDLVANTIELPSFFKFRYIILNNVVNKMREKITKKLKAAYSITIIPDGWKRTFPHMNYLGLGAYLVYSDFRRELVILGIEKMIQTRAEDLREVIQLIVNSYDFNKSKIKGFFPIIIHTYCFKF